MTWWAWMILGAVLLAAELFAVDAQFYLVFLGVSAAVVGFASLLGLNPPEWVQWLAFAIISVAFFVTFRKTLYDKIRGGRNCPVCSRASAQLFLSAADSSQSR